MKFEAGDLQERVIRTCAWQKDEKGRDCYKRDDKDHSEIVCECYHDGCNSAPYTFSAYTALTMGTIFTGLMILLK